MEYKKIRINLDCINKMNEFIKIARKFKSNIDIMSGRFIIDAKSTIGVYSLGKSKDTYIRIISNDIGECKRFEDWMEEFRA